MLLAVAVAVAVVAVAVAVAVAVPALRHRLVLSALLRSGGRYRRRLEALGSDVRRSQERRLRRLLGTGTGTGTGTGPAGGERGAAAGRGKGSVPRLPFSACASPGRLRGVPGAASLEGALSGRNAGGSCSPAAPLGSAPRLLGHRAPAAGTGSGGRGGRGSPQGLPS